ncbi:hypothetical protein ACFSCX_06855 [Bacillus salitolerans]|uniref:Uncharacterized protein n=1 Tax=Bacillus salitolerans TaxID=1437434 RepID=A0ABW4LNE2_9BACI
MEKKILKAKIGVIYYVMCTFAFISLAYAWYLLNVEGNGQIGYVLLIPMISIIYFFTPFNRKKKDIHLSESYIVVGKIKILYQDITELWHKYYGGSGGTTTLYVIHYKHKDKIRKAEINLDYYTMDENDTMEKTLVSKTKKKFKSNMKIKN